MKEEIPKFLSQISKGELFESLNPKSSCLPHSSVSALVSETGLPNCYKRYQMTKLEIT
jgi:hypothetical protein